MSRGWLILIICLAVLAAAGGTAYVVVSNLLRGGADSPEQAVTKTMDSITKKDLVGLFTMVSPHERDSVARIQDAVVKKVKDFKIAESAAKVASDPSAQGGSDISFDGVDLTFTGVQPSVSQISDDKAVVRIGSGQLHVHVDPSRTKGALRSIYDASKVTDVVDQTVNLSDLGPAHSGLSLVATKTDGRWYLSLTLSGLEAANNFQGSARGSIPTSYPAGSDSPQAAAKAAVQATQTLDPQQLAPFLVKDEAAALYLYGNLWNNIRPSSAPFTLGNVDFTEGPHDGDRAQAYVNQVNVSTSSGDRFVIGEKCITDGSGSNGDTCVDRSGYQLSYAAGGLNWMRALFAQDGKFALTTVNEDGKWKVSVLDSAADHVVSWLDSITREQALAMLALPQSEDATGTLTLAKQATVEFNNAGFAVLNLKVDKAMRLALNKDSSVNGVSLYSADGKERLDGISSYGAGATFKPGPYKVVVWANSNDFSQALVKDGNSNHASASLTVSEYQDPATIDGSPTASGNSVYSSDRSFTIVNPSTSDKVLLVSTRSADSSVNSILATLDGKTYQVDAGVGKTTGVPVSPGTHQLTMRTSASSSSSFYWSTNASVDLSYQGQ